MDITYDLADADTANLSVTVAVSTNGGAAYFTPASGLSGDLGSAVVRGNGRKIVWNAGAALPPRLYSLWGYPGGAYYYYYGFRTVCR